MTDEAGRRLRLAARETGISRRIPYSSIVADDVVIGRRGEFYASWELEGVPFETEEDSTLEENSRALNLLYRSLPQGAAVTVHRVRHPFTDSLSAPLEKGFARDFALRLAAYQAEKPFLATRLFLTLMLEGRPGRGGSGRASLESAVSRFSEAAHGVTRALARFGPRRLGIDGGFSSQLSLYNFLLTSRWEKVRTPFLPVHEAIGSARVFFSGTAAEIQTTDGSVFMQGLEVKDFAPETEPGILDSLLYHSPGTDFPLRRMIETQHFRTMGRRDAERFLKTQQKQLLAASDSGVSQIEAITEALDRIADGEFVLGEYSYSLAVFGDTEDEAREAARDAAEKLKAAGLLPFRSALALPGLYFSALPGNLEERPRIARITSMNFAHLAPLHRVVRGKRGRNPWGEALLLMRTPSNSPYYFNFHATSGLEDSLGRMRLGNTVVIGASGTGKTVFLNACAATAQKYRTGDTPLTLVFLDKDRGAECAVSMLPGARYVRLRRGEPTGFNPFALPPTEENLEAATALVTEILTQDGRPLSPLESSKIADAVRAVASLPERDRRLAALPQCITVGASREERENSIAVRLSRWIGDGDLAWVFDNPRDTLDVEGVRNLGIDGTEFLADPVISSPVTSYLLSRISSSMDGRRFILFMDEFWMWLRSSTFQGFASDTLKTIRKKNGLVVFATQSPSDVLASRAARDVVEQCATQVFLPNPRSLEEEYVEGFRLSPVEYEVLRNLAEDSRLMLIRQGRESVVAGLDLSGLPRDLAVLSGNAVNTAVFEEVSREAPAGDREALLRMFLDRVFGREGEKK